MRPYFEPRAGAKPLPYVASVSWPRTGHHLLVHLISAYFGQRFGYCEYHVPREDPNTPCCGNFPCTKRGVIALSKNHDFKFDAPIPTDVPVIVQWREPMASIQSEFELAIMNGRPDTKEEFEAFARRQAEKYRRFMTKWIDAPIANRTALAYEDLVGKPYETLRALLTLWGEDPCDEMGLHQAIQTVPHISVSDKTTKVSDRPGIRADRKVEAFRYFDPALVEEIRRIALTGADGTVRNPPASPSRAAPPPPPPAKAPQKGAQRPADDASERALRPTERLVFHHIPKCAGSVVSDLMAAHFPKNQVFLHGGDVLPTMSAEEIRKYRYFTGHFSKHGVDAVPGPKRVVTILREPRERILSLYYFWRSHTHEAIEQGNLKGPRAAKTLSLKDFLRSDLPEVLLSINNHMVRTMIGPVRLNLSHGFRLNDRDFAVDTAIENLKRYAFVGFLETIDEDVQTLMPLLGLPAIEAVPRVKSFESLRTRKRGFEEIEREPPDEEAWQLLNQLTYLDMTFYRRARQLRHSLRNPYPM